MYKKFSSFEELVLDFKKRDLIALKFADDEDNIHEISYAELAEMIISETERIKAKHGDIEVVRDEQSPETIVSIFAHVMAGCDIIMADPMVPDDAVTSSSSSHRGPPAAQR